MIPAASLGNGLVLGSTRTWQIFCQVFFLGFSVRTHVPAGAGYTGTSVAS